MPRNVPSRSPSRAPPASNCCLPLTLKWAAESGLSLAQALDRVTRRPAAILGVETGMVCVGGPADLCLFDPAEPWTVSARNLASLGKNSPFLGMEMLGRVHYTVIDGHIDYRAR
jgi:dihydroorotase